MHKITKKDFKDLHASGKLKLIQGMVPHSKNVILDILENTPEIEKYLIPVTSYGNLTSDKIGMMTINIYQHGNFIFVEETIDNSKNPNCSWNTTETFNTVYMEV